MKWLLRENTWLATAPDPPATAVPFSSWYSLIQLSQLRQDLALEDAALEAILAVINAVVIAVDPPSRLVAKATFVDTLSQWLGWPQVDLETLIGKSDDLADTGLLTVQLPTDYSGLNLMLSLHRTMSLLKRLGVTAAQANDWCEAFNTDINAKAIRRAAKAKYDEDAWLKVVTPLQDALRDKQREALGEPPCGPPGEMGRSPAFLHQTSRIFMPIS